MFWLTYRCALLPGCSYFLSSGLHLSAVLRCSSWVELTSVRDSRYHECNPGFLISSSGLSPDIRASQPKVDPHHRIMMHPTHQRSSCPGFGGVISLLPSFNCSFSPEIRLCPPWSFLCESLYSFPFSPFSWKVRISSTFREDIRCNFSRSNLIFLHMLLGLALG